MNYLNVGGERLHEPIFRFVSNDHLGAILDEVVVLQRGQIFLFFFVRSLTVHCRTFQIVLSALRNQNKNKTIRQSINCPQHFLTILRTRLKIKGKVRTFSWPAPSSHNQPLPIWYGQMKSFYVIIFLSRWLAYTVGSDPKIETLTCAMASGCWTRCG